VLASSKALVQVVFVSTLFVLTGCIGEEDKDENPTNSDGETVDDTSLALNGFWNGGLDQTETLRVLIYNGNVYGLDEDKGFFGTVESPAAEEVDFSLTAYPFSYEDSGNNEFVADGLAISYTINGLLASNTTLVAEYATDASEFGSITLVNDTTYSNNSSLVSLVGQWTTTDIEINITSRGKFLGFNKATGKDCSFEGQFAVINASNSLLSMTINRRNCDDFNGESTGFAAVNGDGELELYLRSGSSLLFMKFAPPTSSGGDTPADGEGETPAEGDEQTPAG